MGIEYLLLGGGGLSGFEMLGIIHGLQWRGMAKDIKHIASISIGTYFGAFLMIGTDAMVVRRRLISCLEPDKLHISPFDIFRLPYKFHLVNGEHFIEPIKQSIAERWPDVNVDKITMNEFCARCGRSWSIIMTDLSHAMPVVAHNTGTHGDVPVLDLIRASMALPFILRPVLIKGRYYVDGGLTCDNPCLAWSKPNACPPKQNVLQIIIAKLQDGPYKDGRDARGALKSIGHYIQSLMECGMWHKSAPFIQHDPQVIMMRESVMPLLPLRITKRGLWIDITDEKINQALLHGLELFEEWWARPSSFEQMP